MQWKVIKTKVEYKKALKHTMDIFHAEDGSNESRELDRLLALIKDYEDKHIALPESD